MTYIDSSFAHSKIDAIKAALHKWLSDLSEHVRCTCETAEVAKALAELREFDDHQLHDIGLSRSDLTSNGLETAGAWRSLRQSRIDIEIAEMKAREEDLSAS